MTSSSDCRLGNKFYLYALRPFIIYLLACLSSLNFFYRNIWYLEIL